MEESRINWKQILATAIVTGIVTIITGMLLFKWQTQKPKLVYEVPNTSPFRGSNQNFAIYNITISNRGGASVDQVIGVIEVPQGLLEDIRVTADPSLKYTTSFSGQESLTLEIPLLNPNETISIAVLATSQHELPTRPIVSVRGKGVKGVEAEATSSSRDRARVLGIALASAYGGMALSFLSIMRRRRYSLPILGERYVVAGKHSEDQNKVIAYLCGVHGLLDDMEEYLARTTKTTYWAESDRFAAIALSNPRSQDAQRRKQVLKDLLTYAAISRLSKGIVHYNIARISYAQGNVAEAREHLEKAFELSGSLIKTRLRVEPHLQRILEPNSD